MIILVIIFCNDKQRHEGTHSRTHTRTHVHAGVIFANVSSMPLSKSMRTYVLRTRLAIVPRSRLFLSSQNMNRKEFWWVVEWPEWFPEKWWDQLVGTGSAATPIPRLKFWHRHRPDMNTRELLVSRTEQDVWNYLLVYYYVLCMYIKSRWIFFHSISST